MMIKIIDSSQLLQYLRNLSINSTQISAHRVVENGWKFQLTAKIIVKFFPIGSKCVVIVKFSKQPRYTSLTRS